MPFLECPRTLQAHCKQLEMEIAMIVRPTTWTAVAAACALLVACGGGSNDDAVSSVKATDVYPSGVALASPTAVIAGSSTVVASANLPLMQRLGDWWDSLKDATQSGNAPRLARAVQPLLPIGAAHAAPARTLESLHVADYIARVLAGTATPTAANLPLEGFFRSYTAAGCYGPRVAYALHDDSSTDPKQSGGLPGGDVGMWLDRNGNQTNGTPCAAAQLDALMSPVKSRANASLMLGARMVALALAGSGLPATATSKSLTTEFQTFMNGVMPSGTTADVTLAGITNNGSDSYTYQWRVSFTGGEQTRWLVVKLIHTKTSTGFEGLLQYGSSDLNQAASSNCSGDVTADIGTLKYTKVSSTGEIQFSSREAPYCVTNPDELVTDFSTFIALEGDGELDPTKTTSGHANGWDSQGSGFKRFAANFNASTGAGNYLFAWQAGIGDSHSRMFAVNGSYNSTTEQRDLKAFFGFAPNMATTTNPGHLGALICNWAGPGNTHSPSHNRFQSQALKLTFSATDWEFHTDAATSSKIRFAPTNSCTLAGGSTMTYGQDLDQDNVLDAGEVESATTALDTLTGSNTTVFGEITSRGFTLPSLY
jgi:hypothetical protein